MGKKVELLTCCTFYLTNTCLFLTKEPIRKLSIYEMLIIGMRSCRLMRNVEILPEGADAAVPIGVSATRRK